ncbi:MAG: inositol monophosphatase family protein, partial [Dongiaceae bacterium]
MREKAPGDLVTVADEAVEARLAPLLTSLVPGSIVVGEEGAAADPNLLSRLFDDRPVWIIDPVDGTSNFAEGHAAFAVMVALVRGRDVLAAWIHDPVKVRTAVAAAGEGAWLGDRRLAVASAPSAPGDMAGVL